MTRSVSPASSQRLFVGVDIAAQTFTAAWGPREGSPSRPQTFHQDAAGYAAFHKHLAATGIPPAATRVVMEASGVYWVQLAVCLQTAGYEVCVVNPAQAHDYAKSLGRRGKTDAQDAVALQDLARHRELPSWAPPPEVYHQLRQRLVARDGLVQMRQQALNQRHALLHWPIVVDSVRQHLQAVIDPLDEQIRALDKDLAQWLADSDWAPSARLLLSIPGVGVLTAAWLLVTSLNFTMGEGPQSLVQYAGLAPQPHESGTSVRHKPQIGHLGHARLRTVLYMATLSGARYNPVLRPFYQRLLKAGKPNKVARCAVARKLIHLAWAVVTKQQPFDPKYAQRSASAAPVPQAA